MLEAGISIEKVSRILGHASIQITADVYNYVSPEATREAADVMDKVLSFELGKTAPTPTAGASLSISMCAATGDGSRR